MSIWISIEKPSSYFKFHAKHVQKEQRTLHNRQKWKKTLHFNHQDKHNNFLFLLSLPNRIKHNQGNLYLRFVPFFPLVLTKSIVSSAVIENVNNWYEDKTMILLLRKYLRVEFVWVAVKCVLESLNCVYELNLIQFQKRDQQQNSVQFLPVDEQTLL